MMNCQRENRVFLSMEPKLNPLGKLDKGVGETSVIDTGRSNKNPEG